MPTIQELENKLLQALNDFAATPADHDVGGFDRRTTRIYPMDFSIEPEWSFPLERFEKTGDEGVLYRPDIVEEMENMLLHGNTWEGLFVRGPQGVGKSHSLVNLVRSLRSKGHIVTFIPTCETWIDDFGLIEAICKSILSSTGTIGIDRSLSSSTGLLQMIIDWIERALPVMDKHWFFVFDQINRIFARPHLLVAKDVGVLPSPFVLMKILNFRKRMKTVISASANNSVSYKENHPGFRVYDHPLSMSHTEVRVWKPDLAGIDDDDDELVHMKKATGFCPLQISRYLKKSRAAYETEILQDVLSGVDQLLEEKNQNPRATKSIVSTALHCLLSLPFVPDLAYDKKYSVLRNGYVVPLFPLVLVAYRKVFWDELVLFVETNESAILEVCAQRHVTNDVRGRLFELLVIVRFRKNAVLTREPTRDVLPASVDSGCVFETQELPTPQMMVSNTLFIPKNSNFPAIDLILKSEDGTDVWAVQVHVADHEDVLPTFQKMCERKRWFESFDNIYLVYLSPSEAARNMLTCIPRPPQRRSKRPRSQPPKPIQVSATTIHDFECLRDMQWNAPLDMVM